MLDVRSILLRPRACELPAVNLNLFDSEEEFFDFSTVLVTGGAGFIGLQLAEELARQGHHIIILDDLSTGKKENIAALLNSPSKVVPAHLALVP